MTNEELAVLIQAGDRDRLLELWGQVERFAYGRAIRWERALGGRAGMTVEDLLQAAFLALLNAMERWDPECGANFLTYFGTSLKGAFSVACGVRTAKTAQDPLHSAVSLDMPAEPSIQNGETLGDLQPDPAAEAEIEAVDERDRLERLHEALERALGTLPSDGAEAVMDRIYRGKKFNQRAYTAAIRSLRHPNVSRKLRQFLQD